MFGRKIRRIGGILVGKPDVDPAMPSHVPGVRQGNQRGNTAEQEGVIPHRRGAKGTAARSTGINPENRNPIDPRMPNLSPS